MIVHTPHPVILTPPCTFRANAPGEPAVPPSAAVTRAGRRGRDASRLAARRSGAWLASGTRDGVTNLPFGPPGRRLGSETIAIDEKRCRVSAGFIFKTRQPTHSAPSCSSEFFCTPHARADRAPRGPPVPAPRSRTRRDRVGRRHGTGRGPGRAPGRRAERRTDRSGVRRRTEVETRVFNCKLAH